MVFAEKRLYQFYYSNYVSRNLYQKYLTAFLINRDTFFKKRQNNAFCLLEKV